MGLAHVHCVWNWLDYIDDDDGGGGGTVARPGFLHWKCHSRSYIYRGSQPRRPTFRGNGNAGKVSDEEQKEKIKKKKLLTWERERKGSAHYRMSFGAWWYSQKTLKWSSRTTPRVTHNFFNTQLKKKKKKKKKFWVHLNALWLSWDGHFTRDGLLLGRLLFQMWGAKKKQENRREYSWNWNNRWCWPDVPLDWHLCDTQR